MAASSRKSAPPPVAAPPADAMEDFAAIGIRTVRMTSSVKVTADILREEVFRIHAANVFFGREADLIQRLGVSRATFRQAVRLLEHEQLLETRRGGVEGGLYTRRPTSEAVAHFASIYLLSARVGLREVIETMAPIRADVARSIAADPDPAIRSALERYLDSQSGFADTRDYRVIRRVVGSYHRLMAELCGNPMLRLHLDIVREFANETRWDSEFPSDDASMRRYVAAMHDQAAAIARGDGERAAALSQDVG